MFMLEKAITGGRKYWAWILFLIAVMGLGLIAYTRQLDGGLGVTGLSRDIPWGLYVAQFTFLVGIAASSAVMVLPYYAWRDDSFAGIALLSQSLAVASIVTGLLFVFADMGRPSRVFYVLLHPAPESMMFWDMISIIGFLLINVAVTVGTLRAETRHAGIAGWTKILVLISIPWALAMRTLSALLYSGLAGRSFWLSAAMAPRALASACATGAALMILICLVLARVERFEVGREPLRKLALIAAVGTITNLFFMIMEFFTISYSGVPEPMDHISYVLGAGIGIWTWVSVILAAVSAVVMLAAPGRDSRRALALGSAMVCGSFWIEKSVQLAGGFMPSSSGTISAYVPTLAELSIAAGIWATGLLMITVFCKVTLAIRS